MKLTIKKSDLLPVLSNVQGLTGRKTSLAITTNLLIKTHDSGIRISATDLETGFEGLYPAVVEDPGNIAINARKFFEIVHDFPGEDIVINEIENHWIEIGSQQVEYHIVGMNTEDFPEIPRMEGVDYFKIDSAAFSKMIEKVVIISGASDDRRAHIIGIYAQLLVSEQNQKIFRLVSTDGSRLSKVDGVLDPDEKVSAGSGVLIPKKAMVEVNKFLDPEGQVRLGIKDSNLIIKKDRETLIVRLLEGTFPEYEDIIQKHDGHAILMDRPKFLMMLKRMSILASEDYKGVIFKFADGKLLINSTNPDIGESKEDMEINFSGHPISVMFNPRFFIETLNVIDEQNVVLHLVNEQRPCLVEAEHDKNYLSVIMPMRI